jgi:hypothetical protein
MRTCCEAAGLTAVGCSPLAPPLFFLEALVVARDALAARPPSDTKGGVPVLELLSTCSAQVLLGPSR